MPQVMEVICIKSPDGDYGIDGFDEGQKYICRRSFSRNYLSPFVRVWKSQLPPPAKAGGLLGD